MNQSRRIDPESSPVKTVHIVASCTQGKRYPVPSALRLGSIPNGSLVQRLATWKDRLHDSGVDRVAAVDLYRGQHWAVVRELPTVAQEAGYQADLWVSSAGYGLIPAEAKICPYSATFSASEEDSVWRPDDGERRTALRTWWSKLQTLPASVTGEPRSLTALAGRTPEAAVLVIASPAYVVAMSEDLDGARSLLVDPKHLIIISSRDGALPEWLTSHLVPSEAPLSCVLGGARGSLHARTARRILQEAAAVPLHANVLVPRYRRLVSEVERPASPVRLRLSDDDVRKFIREAIAGNRNLTYSAALRRLRTTGQACEQRRFAELYAEVMGRADVA